MNSLVSFLDEYSLRYPSEKPVAEDFTEFVQVTNERPFHRENLARHFTASAWLLNPTETKVLLTHHKKLNIWVQLGGHCDGDSDVLAGAIREAREESGIEAVEPITFDIFDIDKHAIPARIDEPEHFHYDIRFLLKAGSEKFAISEESQALQWFHKEDPFLNSQECQSLWRMLQKWKNLRTV